VGDAASYNRVAVGMPELGDLRALLAPEDDEWDDGDDDARPLPGG
jgi:hypothetical protein